MQSYETLKNVVDQREQELLTKSNVEQEAENIQNEMKAVKMANEEYRKVLKQKVSEIMNAKRELESSTKNF